MNDNRLIFEAYLQESDEQPELNVSPRGDRFWRLDGLYHREDGPAVEWTNGTKLWYRNGLRHREDGPAAEYNTGGKIYCLNDVKYPTIEKYAAAVLKLHNKEVTSESIRDFVRQILSKQAQNFI